MPTLNIVSSERDAADLLIKLDKYATCTTLNTHPDVGGNTRFHEKKPLHAIHFEQAPTFRRDVRTTVDHFHSRNYHTWLA